jgi:hypothetical protein
MDTKLTKEERIDHVRELMDNGHKMREERLKEFWENLKPFNEPHDVPNLPNVGKEKFDEIYVPKLIDAGAIQKKDLIDGQVYIGEHRRCQLAKWNKEKNVFEYWRYKFGTTFIDRCNHFQDDDGFALFVPIKLGEEKDYV